MTVTLLDVLPIVIDHWLRPSNTICSTAFMTSLAAIYTQRHLVYRFRCMKHYAIDHAVYTDTHEDDDIEVDESCARVIQYLRDMIRDMFRYDHFVYKVCDVCHAHVLHADDQEESVDEFGDMTYKAYFSCSSHTCSNAYMFSIDYTQ
jgi:hypothetical protein